MGRPVRIEYAGALYHITSRGNEKKEIFLTDDDRTKFLNIIRDYHERYGILVHAYVLLDNHYHLILETPRGNLLKVMHGLNGSYTGYFNRKYRRVGHLLQGRYRAILVDKGEYLLPLSRYVHLNPVRAGIVESPEKYPWSSYMGYIGKAKKEDWVEYRWVLSHFGRGWKRAAKKYKGYVAEGILGVGESPLKALFAQLVLGGEKFKDRIMAMLKAKKLGPEIVARRKLTAFPTLEEIVRGVSEAFGVKKDRVLLAGKRLNPARNVALYLAQRYTGLANEEIGRLFGGIHYSAVSKAAARVREAMAADRELGKIVMELDSHFKA
jgi:REP element-mobilizing transposase RayT